MNITYAQGTNISSFGAHRTFKFVCLIFLPSWILNYMAGSRKVIILMIT